jgi:hypothetical protein
MPRRNSLFLRPLLTACLGLSLASAADEVPWSETFSMVIGGQERSFAVYHKGSYLVLATGDAGNRNLLLGTKDVVIASKFERDGGNASRARVRLSNFPDVIAEADAALFTTHLEGDNLFLFGSLSTPASGKSRFEVQFVETAPSDAQVIAQLLNNLAPEDYAGRLKAGAAIRDRAATQPNKEFWLSAGDNVMTQVIDDVAAAAEKKKDAALLEQAITWSIDLLHDPAKAGKVGSAAWIRVPNTPGAEEVTRRMRRLGMEFYKDQWRPRAESLGLEFEDRFAAISWKDADGYYRLGRWADIHGEFLPQAKDRSYRCYQAGFRANPKHQGIRNELGMPNDVRGDGTQNEANADYVHSASGTVIQAPPNWKRGDRIEGDITWIDPTSESAYIAGSVIETPENPLLGPMWVTQLAGMHAKPEFTQLEEDELTFPLGQAKRLRWQYKEGNFVRLRETILALNPTAKIAVRLDSAYAEDEQTQVHQILISTFDRLVIPNQAPSKP